ncbi:hypothetical protein NXW11_24730 [Bacteroides thetaiotaomicron]|uniref:hypothetical protein n=1 Tax=Bacteroides thetaiotaomicron TaxID=818 RepID=UPI002165777D|nr:hypothetical protein [Bacteroides thetaiotaomicron]
MTTHLLRGFGSENPANYDELKKRQERKRGNRGSEGPRDRKVEEDEWIRKKKRTGKAR